MERELSRQQKIWIWGRTFLKAAGPLGLYILMPALSMTIGYVAAHPDMTAQEFFTYGGNFYTALGMVLTIYMLYRGSKKKGHGFFEDATLYLEQADRKKCAGFFVFGLSAAVTISAVLTLLPRWGVVTGYSEASQTMFKGRDMLFTIITTVVTAPFVEEIVFRGYMLNTFLETFDEKKSIVMASLIFALCHGEFLWILYAFVMGAVLAWVSVREDNVLYGILLHMGFNASSVITWLTGSMAGWKSALFGSKALIFCYGLMGGLTSLVLIQLYIGRRKAKP